MDNSPLYLIRTHFSRIFFFFFVRIFRAPTVVLSKNVPGRREHDGPIVMGFVQPGTRRGMDLQMMGSLNTVPPRMFLIVSVWTQPHLLQAKF